MKNRISLIIVFTFLLYGNVMSSQTGRATISQVNNGSTIEISIYLKSTGDSEWSLGFASFVFSYNRSALENAVEYEEGIWDNNTNPEYSDQIIVPYSGGNSESIEIGLNSISPGTVVSPESTLVGIVRFNILNDSANHNVRWNLNYCAVLDNMGNNITSGIIFTDPENGILPVELSDFSADVIQNNVILKWETSVELNNSGFSIERSAVNGHWNQIGFVTGSGYSSTLISYLFEDKNLISGKYNYRLKQIDYNGSYQYYTLNENVHIGIPERFSLNQNYPNPFNPVTKISFDIPAEGNVMLRIFDNTGRLIRTLVNEIRGAGYYTTEFNGADLSSGTYYCRLESGNFSDVKKLVLLK
ncbi:MAG TPA: T9SS type A sorting domain-containing protein [Ignavibacteria bacterium]|nr:T9SS type A sorting domain-containing protein [Ignavibacteria bacterium]